MSFKLTKKNLDSYLLKLGKEFRKLNKKTMPAEIILIGGASILANYGFRDLTYDIDAIIAASSVMKDAINRVGDELGLPNGWLNTNFIKTTSYSDKLCEVSIYYKTFSNILTVRTIAAEYLIAMKLMSGRQYKFDMSDIVGILLEHQRLGKTISLEQIQKAFIKLYGSLSVMPSISKEFIEGIINSLDLESDYLKVRSREKIAKEAVINFNKDNSGIKNADTINKVIEQAKKLLESKGKDGC